MLKFGQAPDGEPKHLIDSQPKFVSQRGNEIEVRVREPDSTGFEFIFAHRPVEFYNIRIACPCSIAMWYGKEKALRYFGDVVSQRIWRKPCAAAPGPFGQYAPRQEMLTLDAEFKPDAKRSMSKAFAAHLQKVHSEEKPGEKEQRRVFNIDQTRILGLNYRY